MAGKREKRQSWKKTPAVLAMLMVSAALLTPGGPAGAVREPARVKAGETVLAARLAGSGKQDSGAEGKRTQAKTAAAVSEEPFGPVPESEAVEDTYFEDAVFLGDSRTEGFRLYSGLKTGTYLCGVGATVESVFTKKVWPAEGKEKVPLLDALAETGCGKVYLMLGINELGWSKEETFHDQYAKVIDRIREDHPDAEIILQTILPVSAKQDAKGSYVNNQRIGVYNEVIRALAEEKDCALVDVAEALAGEDGCLPKELNFDGVHLNPAGCRIWLEYLRTHSVEEKK